MARPGLTIIHPTKALFDAAFNDRLYTRTINIRYPTTPEHFRKCDEVLSNSLQWVREIQKVRPN